MYPKSNCITYYISYYIDKHITYYISKCISNCARQIICALTNYLKVILAHRNIKYNCVVKSFPIVW